MPLTRENGFLPDLKAIDPATAKAAKVIVVNYPNNPTAAVAEADFYQELVEFALANDIIVVSDVAYTEMSFDGYEPLSFMQTPGQGGGHRVPQPLQDLQHDRLAPGLRGG